MEWHWHQLDNMQSICCSLQTDNHASTSSLNFWQVRCSSWGRTISVKSLKYRDNLECALTTTPQPFYGPLSRTTLVSRCQKRTSVRVTVKFIVSIYISLWTSWMPLISGVWTVRMCRKESAGKDSADVDKPVEAEDDVDRSSARSWADQVELSDPQN